MTISTIEPAALPELRRARCVLKPLLTAHVTPRYVAWLNDPAINQYLESRFVQHSVESVRAFVDAQWASGAVCFYGIWAPAGQGGADLHIGNIKLGPIDRHHLTGDLGFLVGEADYWGKGIAGEAIALMVELGSRLGLRKITAGAYENNLGSAKALLRAGFVEEGLRPSQVVFNGDRVGVKLFGIACS